MTEDDQSFRKDAERPQRGLLSEFVYFAANNKKWWLTPIVIMIFLIGVLVLVGGSGAAPFIYTLF